MQFISSVAKELFDLFYLTTSYTHCAQRRSREKNDHDPKILTILIVRITCILLHTKFCKSEKKEVHDENTHMCSSDNQTTFFVFKQIQSKDIQTHKKVHSGLNWIDFFIV